MAAHSKHLQQNFSIVLFFEQKNSLIRGKNESNMSNMAGRESFRGNAKTVPKVVLRDVHDTWSAQCVLKHNVIEMARCDVWTS